MAAHWHVHNSDRNNGTAFCHRGGAIFLLLLMLSVVIGGGALVIKMKSGRSAARQRFPEAANELQQEPGETSAPARRHPVTINPGPPAPKIDCGVVAPDGTPVTVSCATCHANRKPDPANRTSSDLTAFHQSIQVVHGNLTCLSCHNESDYNKLKLADGTAIEYPEVMQLCAQCHGQQMTDYLHGAHGGMTGYWDLSKGPRWRNNCVDCHLAHQPAFPSMEPTFKPLDRIPGGQREGISHD